jgi:hypothetical protein
MRGSRFATRARARVSSSTSHTTTRLVLLAVAVAVVASIVVPAFASAESGAADTSRPPHTDAPARASTTDRDTTARVAAYVAAVQAAQLRTRVAGYVAAKQREAIASYVDATQRAAAARAAARHRRSNAVRSTSGTPRGANASSPGGFLACVRRHESGGNYAALNGRSGTAGAYQFMPGTWNNTARSAGRPDLVGVNPAAANAADQDALAQHLYATQGAAPWTGTGC